MAVTLHVSDVRAEIYKSAGGLRSSGAGAASTAMLGRIFHQAFAELVGINERNNFHTALDEVESSLEEWRAALINHTYQRIVGPRLRQHQAELNFAPEQALTFWDATQELCKWLAELLWKAQESGMVIDSSLITAEQPLRWELREAGWTDGVVLTGIADAICRTSENQNWCLIELKTGRTAPEADLAQACLYHQMLKSSGMIASGALALVSFEPQKHEKMFTAADLVEAQDCLRDLVGRLAGVLPDEIIPIAPPPPDPKTDGYRRLGKQLEKAFAEYNARIKAGEPIVGPTFLRFPIELGRGVTINALQRYVQSVQARLGLEAPPRVSLEGGRLAIDVQRPDREFVYFAQIRDQLPSRDGTFGSARVSTGVDLSGRLQLADFAQPENAHLLVAGTPGSGKSEWLRAAIGGLVIANTPQTMRLALADPKRNAFQQLGDSPFLYSEITYDENSVTLLLERLIEEMETRYEEMGKVKADKLTDYIRLTGATMPRVFFVCDEYADLMMGEKKKKQALEGMIRRLGQKARAAGIHMILATQQPSRQVTSGPIMAVITAKVALRMDAINSRIFLGEAGAESLLGKGDLLYKCIGDPVRLQSPYLPEEELKAVFGGAAR